MKSDKKKNTVCHDCEQEFIDEMNRLAGADGSSPHCHPSRSRELHEAFVAREKRRRKE